MNKWLKFSLYILIILTTVVLTSTVVLGYNYNDFYNGGSRTNGPQQVLDISVNFLSIAKVAGYVLGLVFIFLLAIQFMTATPNKKAELKTRAWMYTLGIVLLITIPTMMDWVGDMGATLSTGTGSSGSGSAGSGLDAYIEQNSAGNDGIEGFWSIFKGKSTGSTGSSGSTGGGTITPTSNPTSTPSTTPTTTPTPSSPPTGSGYVPPAGSTLQEGDRIYFTVDAEGKINGGDDNWNNPDYYYVMKSGEYIESGSDGYWLVQSEMRRPLGIKAGGGANCFQGTRDMFDTQGRITAAEGI